MNKTWVDRAVEFVCFALVFALVFGGLEYIKRMSAKLDALEGAKVVIPPVTFTKWAETPFDISECYDACMNPRPVAPDDDYNYACETCLANMEGAGVACGIVNKCGAKQSVEVVTGLIHTTPSREE